MLTLLSALDCSLAFSCSLAYSLALSRSLTCSLFVDRPAWFYQDAWYIRPTWYVWVILYGWPASLVSIHHLDPSQIHSTRHSVKRTCHVDVEQINYLHGFFPQDCMYLFCQQLERISVDLSRYPPIGMCGIKWNCSFQMTYLDILRRLPEVFSPIGLVE